MDRYYYAGGKRVALELEPERIAVDPAKARGAGMADLARRVERDGTRLPGGRVVVGRATLGAADLLLLRESGGAQAVYAGSAPGQLCGVVQINVLLPSIAGTVDLRPQFRNPVTGEAGGASAIGATVAVK